MDPQNRFGTRTTFGLLRLEYGAFMLACVVLLVQHYRQIDWATFIALFAVIDVVGYIPGAIVYRVRQGDAPKLFYVLYNTMHSFTTWVAVFAVWSLVGEPGWAFLAVPIHLCGDRSLFGNMLKTFHVTYEPKPHPAFATFEKTLARTAA